MKKYLLILLLLPATLSAQEINKVVYDSIAEQEIIFGECTRDFLESYSPFNLYYSDEYRSYTPNIPDKDSATIHLQEIEITIVLGTWCSDSETQVPRFFKVLDESGYNTESIDIYCVNREKVSDAGQTDTLMVEKVPTFIFYRDGKEIGRIVESPEETLEADLLAIIKPED